MADDLKTSHTDVTADQITIHKNQTLFLTIQSLVVDKQEIHFTLTNRLERNEQNFQNTFYTCLAKPDVTSSEDSSRVILNRVAIPMKSPIDAADFNIFAAKEKEEGAGFLEYDLFCQKKLVSSKGTLVPYPEEKIGTLKVPIKVIE